MTPRTAPEILARFRAMGVDTLLPAAEVAVLVRALETAHARLAIAVQALESIDEFSYYGVAARAALRAIGDKGPSA